MHSSQSFHRLWKKNREGFTLIELLIGMGIMGVLSSIVIVALNPQKQLCDAMNAKRQVHAGEVKKALEQYLVDEWDLPGDIPNGEQNALPICRNGITDASCVNLDILVPEYLATLPVDDLETNPLHTGFDIYLGAATRAMVEAMYLQDCATGTGVDTEGSTSSGMSSGGSASSATSVASGGSAGSGGASSAGGLACSPSDLAATRDLALWLQPDGTYNAFGGSPSDGQEVATWADQSPMTANLTQSTTTLRPIYRSAGQGGVDFDGLNDILTGTNGFDNFAGTVMVVFESDNWDRSIGKGVTLVSGHGMQGDEFVRVGVGYNGDEDEYNLFYQSLDQTNGFSIWGCTDVGLGTHMATFTVNGSEQRIWLDGFEEETETIGAVVTPSIFSAALGRMLLNYQSELDPFNGKIREVIIFNETLTSQELSCLHAQLANTYGITLSTSNDPLCGTVIVCYCPVAGVACSSSSSSSSSSDSSDTSSSSYITSMSSEESTSSSSYLTSASSEVATSSSSYITSASVGNSSAGVGAGFCTYGEGEPCPPGFTLAPNGGTCWAASGTSCEECGTGMTPGGPGICTIDYDPITGDPEMLCECLPS